MKQFLLVCVLGVHVAAPAQESLDLGEIAFANSGSRSAQAPFLRGVTALHSFWYAEARRAFREAHDIDPDFVLAYWGEAMTYHQSLWNRQDRNAAQAALAKLAPTTAERMAKPATPREKMFLKAAEILFGEGDRDGRVQSYRRHMQRMSNRFPEDVDIAAFYALSILGSIDLGKDYREAVLAAARLEPFFASHPKHPGVLHYLIHAYDDPVHAPLGLRAAEIYAKVAPSSAHALHMPSHIFLQRGRWSDVVSSNIDASDAALAHDEPGQYDHAMTWWHYALLQQGRFEEAWDHLLAYLEKARGFSGRAQGHAAVMAARNVIESRRWEEVDAWPALLNRHTGDDRVLLAFGLADAFRGHTPRAQEIVRSIQTKVADQRAAGRERRALASEIRWGMVQVVIYWMENCWEEAEALMPSILAKTDQLGTPIGPPTLIQPPYELFGELLLTMEEPERAGQMFRKGLDRTANRSHSLAGLAVASSRTGEREEATQALAGLKVNWGDAKPPQWRDVSLLLEERSYGTTLSGEPSHDRHPNWSPDGSLLVYEINHENRAQIAIRKPGSPEFHLISPDSQKSSSPSWHPNGKRIVYHASPQGEDDLFTMNPDGTDIRQLTRHPAPDRFPRFSPDGNRIAFTSVRDGNLELYLCEADGANPKRLTYHPQRDLWPSWSPDGSRLVFFSRRDTHGRRDELYIIHLDSGQVERLTHHPTHDFTPSWSPDGHWIAWSGKRTGGRPELYAMHLQDRVPIRLTFDGFGDTTVNWSPDSLSLTWSAYNQTNYDLVSVPFNPSF